MRSLFRAARILFHTIEFGYRNIFCHTPFSPLDNEEMLDGFPDGFSQKTILIYRFIILQTQSIFEDLIVCPWRLFVGGDTMGFNRWVEFVVLPNNKSVLG